jgi:hypothetical protein
MIPITLIPILKFPFTYKLNGDILNPYKKKEKNFNKIKHVHEFLF